MEYKAAYLSEALKILWIPGRGQAFNTPPELKADQLGATFQQSNYLDQFKSILQ
jgi:hypothetical protein